MQTHECKESTHNASHKGTQDKHLVYNQLLSFYCHNACESKINLYIDILCKHMAILSVHLTQRHHTNAVEPYFLFLHTFIIYKPFNKRQTS